MNSYYSLDSFKSNFAMSPGLSSNNNRSIRQHRILELLSKGGDVQAERQRTRSKDMPMLSLPKSNSRLRGLNQSSVFDGKEAIKPMRKSRMSNFDDWNSESSNDQSIDFDKGAL